MYIRYIGAVMIALLFSSFYQAPIHANGELAGSIEATTALTENSRTAKKQPFLTRKKIIIAVLALVAAGVISWGVYKTFIQEKSDKPGKKPKSKKLDAVVLPRNAGNDHDVRVSFVIGDITQQNFAHQDEAAIVNAANERMLGGGDIDGAIHRAAGPGLVAECARVPQVRAGIRCPTGEARITGGHNLAPVRIIHTVGPNIQGKKGPDKHDAELLENVYRNVLQVATDNDLREVAIPSISTGIFAYPLDEAADIAADTIREFIDAHATDVDEIRFVLNNENTAQTYRNAFAR